MEIERTRRRTILALGIKLGKRDEDSSRWEQHGRQRGLPRCGPLGAETAVEHDEDERYGCHVLGNCEVVERDFQDPVNAAEHADADECYKDGNSDAVWQLVREDTDNKNERAENQDLVQLSLRDRTKGRFLSMVAAAEDCNTHIYYLFQRRLSI